MIQYFMPKELDYDNLRKCLDNFTPTKIYIRLMGSKGGTAKVDENLEGRILDVQEINDEWAFSIDGSEVFRRPLEERNNDVGLTLTYEDEAGIPIFGEINNPNDPKLPVGKSILRYDLDCHLIEISFSGRIRLKPDSVREGFPYWIVDASPEQ